LLRESITGHYVNITERGLVHDWNKVQRQLIYTHTHTHICARARTHCSDQRSKSGAAHAVSLFSSHISYAEPDLLCVSLELATPHYRQ